MLDNAAQNVKEERERKLTKSRKSVLDLQE